MEDGWFEDGWWDERNGEKMGLGLEMGEWMLVL